MIMNLYKRIRERIEDEYITSGALKAGERLPAYSVFKKRYEVSLETIMRAVNEMENDGLLIRESPRKLLISQNSSDVSDAGVGMMGFYGDIFGEFEKKLKHRLYERKTFTYSVNPPTEEKDSERYFQRFFQNKYKTLLVRDHEIADPSLVEKHSDKFDKLILVFEQRSKNWTLPRHGLFLDLDHAMYLALKTLRLKGYSRIVLFTPGPATDITSNGRRKSNGLQRFLKEFDLPIQSDEFIIDVKDSHEFNKNENIAVDWARSLHPDTDAIVGSGDFSIIKALEWIKEYSNIDYSKIACIGRGNTNWSSAGPNKFASFDYRIDDFVTAALELLDESVENPVEKWLKPKLKRAELVSSQ